jgi:DnaJ-class molecular chaperone
MVMNISRAREILGLPERFDETLLKKRYHISAIRYHPDKNKDPGANDKFHEIKAAYEFLLKNKNSENLDSVLGNIFKTFTTQFVFPKRNPKNQKFLRDLSIILRCVGKSNYILVR